MRYHELSNIQYGTQIEYSLYHISFRDNLEGVWIPRNPDGLTEDLSEPDLPRISVSPSIVQCFQAIYPNVSKYFEVDDYPHMDFHVYQPHFVGNERVLTPSFLTQNHMVHDAFLTEEHCILDPTFMTHIGSVRIQNTNGNQFLTYHPFDDPQEPERGFAPSAIKFSWLTRI